MSNSKLPLLRLSEMVPGQSADFFALLAEKIKSATRDNKPFYVCRFRDKLRTATLMVWADSPTFEVCEREWRAGDFYKLRGKLGESERYGLQIELDGTKIRAATDKDKETGFDQFQLIESSRFDPKQMFAELKELATMHLADEPLRRLVLTLLDKYAEPLQRLPASRDKYHVFAGGLLEHTLAVTRSCLQLVERYTVHYAELQPPLNRDLVVAAAILHEIGRVIEFGGEVQAPSLTIPGRLVGHLILGRDLVREAARDIPELNAELLQLLEHILLSYLTLPEWGSPRLPLIPEVLILHHADDLDAKLEMYVRCLSRDKADGPFTDRDPALNRQLYKGRSV